MTTLTLLSKEKVNMIFEALTPSEFIDLYRRGKPLRYIQKGQFYVSEKFITFDIEVSHDETNEHSWMYHWQMFLFDQYLVFGRTWKELKEVFDLISKKEDLIEYKRIIPVFIHNAGYEFQFMKGQFTLHKLFARAIHDPLKFVFSEWRGLVFRDSFAFIKKSLENASKDYDSCRFIKEKTLDYHKIFNNSTKLTIKEKKYCAIDVIALYDIIKEISKKYKTAYNIPLTLTGIIKESAYRDYGRTKGWRKIVNNLSLNVATYQLYSNAARGGDTHGEAWAAAGEDEKIWGDVYAYDITSSYPYQMAVNGIYPLSPGIYHENLKRKEFEYVEKRGWLYVAEFFFKNIKLKKGAMSRSYIPAAKCINLPKDFKNDNGRVVSASYVLIAITNFDFDLIKRYYTFDDYLVTKICYHIESGALPKEFREFILKNYDIKTKYKGVEEKEEDYKLSKEQINGMYGIHAMRLLFPNISIIDNEWVIPPIINDNEKLIKRQSSFNFFTPYPIGVFTTANARYMLHNLLKELPTAIYWDTDSVYCIGDQSKVVDKLNAECLKKIEDCGIDKKLAIPLTVSGEESPIGVWSKEYGGKPIQFKFFAAKKYMLVDSEGNEKITVAGLNKKSGKEWAKIKKGSVLNINLNDTVPEEYSGRTSAKYIDEPFELIIKGKKVGENSCLLIRPVTYKFSDTPEHISYILSEREVKEKWILTQ